MQVRHLPLGEGDRGAMAAEQVAGHRRRLIGATCMVIGTGMMLRRPRLMTAVNRHEPRLNGLRAGRKRRRSEEEDQDQAKQVLHWTGDRASRRWKVK